MRNKTIVKTLIMLILLLYVFIVQPTTLLSKLDAIGVLILSVVFMFKSKDNQIVLLISFFVMYCNYSIVLSEYLIGGHLAVPLQTVKTPFVYGTAVRTLLVFMSIVTLYFRRTITDVSSFLIKPKRNDFIYIVLLGSLIYTFLFGVSRGGDLSSYSVRISPLYEYSTIIFVYAYYYSGKSIWTKFPLLILGGAFIIQDFYYGGRITAFQIILFILYTIMANFISLKNVLTYGLFGITVNSLVGAFRNTRTFDGDLIANTLERLKDSYFVFDTPVYAYYASATHIATTQIIGIKERLTSLFYFIKAIFVGSNVPIGNVTYYIHQNYFINIGGGIIPTFFYFWLGWSGVVLGSIIVVYLLNGFSSQGNDLKKFCLIIFAITVPRWYVYTPLMIFRPMLFSAIAYLFLGTVHKIMTSTFN